MTESLRQTSFGADFFVSLVQNKYLIIYCTFCVVCTELIRTIGKIRAVIG